MQARIPCNDQIVVRLPSSLRRKIEVAAKTADMTASEFVRAHLAHLTGHADEVLAGLTQEAIAMDERLKKAMVLVGQQISLYEQAKNRYIELKGLKMAAETLAAAQTGAQLS